MERRYSNNTVQRAAGDLNPDGLPLKFGGIAAVVGVVTDMGWYEEEIQAGAFDEALADSNLDVRCLFNHENELILGRTKSGTCRLGLDDKGNLIYEYDADYRNPLHTQVGCSIDRKDITQSSFAFTIKEVSWVESAKYGTMNKRVITKIDKLFDVSPVTYPAYEDTEVDCRDRLIEERSQFTNVAENVTAKNEKELRMGIDLCKLIRLK